MLQREFCTRTYEFAQQRLQSVSLRTGLNLSKPTFVCIKLTMRCNAQCKHCDIYKPEHTIPELPGETWTRVLRDLRQWLGYGAPLTVTGGEIFLRRDAFDILGTARDQGLALYMLSNGWLIHADRAQRIMDLDARVVQLSLDGTEFATHDYLRGIDGFGERAQAAIRYLVDAKRAKQARTKLVLSCVVFKHNLDELGPLAHWAAEHGVDEIKYQPIEQTYGEAPDPNWWQRSPLWVDDLAAAERAIDAVAAAKAAGAPVANSPESLQLMKEYFSDPLGRRRQVVSHDSAYHARRCRTAVSDFDIDADGHVRLCYEMDPIGNVAEQSPRDIWNNRDRCWTKPCSFLQ